MKLCTRGLSTNLKAPIFGKNSKSASTVKWVVPQFQISGFEFPVALSTSISVRCTRSSVHVSSPVIQSDINSSTLHIPEENLEGVEKNLEKVIYSCRFFAILAVWGSLIGSFLCFIKGCSCVVESFQAYFAIRAKVIVYLVEALDIYLLGTVMLVFGMGLYELFISNLDKGKSMSRETTPYRSNLFGMFTLKERPRWLEITTVSGLKTKIGHVIVMLLLIGLFDKSKRAVINSPFDLLCFSASVLLCSGCLYQFIYPILVSFVTALGLVSITLCIVAEFKKTKKKDLRFDGKLCYLPGSVAFELGIGALICLLMAQVIGNLLICRTFFSKDHENSSKSSKKKPTLLINGFICALSWMSFVMAIILIGAASSMSKSQAFGEGWVDGECYIVKEGVYIISAILVFVTLSSTLVSFILKKKQVEIRWQHTSTS